MWYNGAGGDFLTHLLVVDDEVSILELIKNSLGKDGYLITVCQNADDVDIKKLHFYDLILLDVMMPGTDGFEFCKQIRNMVDCPILFLTAKTLEEDILFGLGIGADDYITKPFRFLYKGIIIKHNKTEPTYTKTSLFLCEKRRFLWPGLRKEGNLFKLAGPGGLAFFHLTKKEVSKWPMKK